jgi:hypothetical protein
MPKSVLYKNDLMLLDIIAADKWKRPIYFTSPVTATRIGLGDYLETDGLTYRLVPVRSQESNNSILEAGNVNTAFMYQNLMNKFRFGGAQTAGTYFDEPNRRMLLGIRNSFAKLGMALALDGKKDSAVRVLNKCDSNILQQNFPYALTSPGNMHNINSLQTVYAYYLAGDSTKGDEIAEELINDCQQQLIYYNTLSSSEFGPTLQQDARTANMIISQLQQWMSLYGKKAKGTHSEELPVHMDSLKQPSKQDHPVKAGGQGK